MENEKKDKGLKLIIGLLAVIILVLVTLLILVATGKINFKSNSIDEQTNKSEININKDTKKDNDDNDSNNSKSNECEIVTKNFDEDKIKSYFVDTKRNATTKSMVHFNNTVDKREDAMISIVDGKIVVNTIKQLYCDSKYLYDTSSISSEKVYEIENEKIRYFFTRMAQCGATIVIYYLTESGNVYVTQYNYSSNDNTDIFDSFEKLKYSNISEIKAIDNDNYGKPLDEKSGIKDNMAYYLYAIGKDEKYLLEYQYRC